MRNLTLVAVAALALSSTAHSMGANSDKNLKRATAIAVGNDTPSDSVVLSEIHRHMMSVEWKAQTPSGKYICDADDMVRQVHCIKDKTVDATPQGEEKK